MCQRQSTYNEKKNKKKNLPSTSTCVVNTSDEMNGAKGTKKDNNSVANTVAVKGDADGTINEIPETIVNMLDLARVKDGEIHEEVIQKVIDVTTALIKKNTRMIKSVRCMSVIRTYGKYLLQKTT